ncbi:hypothetical protein DFH28DRAFT_633136 [Melampsora americana]|nr:hypothetical protein DFH28DRAFT_633136 [Melampsora americana]
MAVRGKETPSYIGAPKPRSEEVSIWKQILIQEFKNPASREANLRILTGFGTFALGITFLKFAGDLLVPNF